MTHVSASSHKLCDAEDPPACITFCLFHRYKHGAGCKYGRYYGLEPKHVEASIAKLEPCPERKRGDCHDIIILLQSGQAKCVLLTISHYCSRVGQVSLSEAEPMQVYRRYGI